MKNFFQYLAPFSPDYSGASSVLYDAGGMIVMCDPGGCSGIICGYDEPRFYGGKTPLYSAALREMDAILGRDQRLVEKIVAGAAGERLSFIALLGGPVVSVVGTDLSAVARKAEERTGVPCFAVDTTGMGYYDSGEEKALLALLKKFLPAALPEKSPVGGKTLVLGGTPLELTGTMTFSQLRDRAKARWGGDTVIGGDEETVALLRHPEEIGRLVAASVPGLRAAEKLGQRLGLSPQVWFPENQAFDRALKQVGQRGGRFLILHQQVCANMLRTLLEREDRTITVASFFAMEDSLTQPGDRFLTGEDELVQLAETERFDGILCDPFYLPALGDFGKTAVALSHPAVSGDYFL